jgi:hypothetical protein
MGTSDQDRISMSASAGTVAESKLNGAISDNLVAAAEEAGLQYVSDERPGYTRRAKGKGFDYFDTDEKSIRDEHRLLRIKRLAIPPAWTDVWICASQVLSSGLLAATLLAALLAASALLTATLLATLFLALAAFTFLSLAVPLLAALSGGSGFDRWVRILLCVHIAFLYY